MNNQRHLTLKQLKERTEKSRRDKTAKEKRLDKIKKLQSTPEWPNLEQVMYEDLSGLNKFFIKLRTIYSSGKKYSMKEWIEVMNELLDEVD